MAKTLNLIQCEILGVSPQADIAEVRKAYLRLVKANHPDLFAAEQKLVQELKMMRINEAYRELIDAIEEADSVLGPGDREGKRTENEHDSAAVDGWDYALHGSDPVLSDSRTIGFHHDAGYVYYKQGFVHYSRGLGGIMGTKLRYAKLTPDTGGLRRSLFALQSFQKAYDYFRRVVTEYPESIWFRDASVKIERIRGYSRIYLRIRRNLEARMRAAESERVEPQMPAATENSPAGGES